MPNAHRVRGLTGPLIALLLLACNAGEAGPAPSDNELPAGNALAAAQAPATEGQLGHTGTPAQPETDGPVSDRNQVIAMEDIDARGGPVCRIEFAYEGYAPETILWPQEPCSALTARFMDRAQLEEFNRWDRIGEDGQRQIVERTGGQVLYVGGEFTASVYPMDYNHLTSEISVAD